jgi:hypothetical protein
MFELKDPKDIPQLTHGINPLKAIRTSKKNKLNRNYLLNYVGVIRSLQLKILKLKCFVNLTNIPCLV